MQSKAESIIRAINNNGEKLNILTAPTHERLQSNMSGLNHTFYLLQVPNVFKGWNFQYADLPKNHILLDGSNTQIKADMKFDIVLSQNKFGQFEILDKIARDLNIPLVSIEHTLPVPTWNKAQRDRVKNMRGKVNIFISDYSIKEWGFDPDDPTVKVIRHAINTDIFKPIEDGHNDGRVMTCVNDWVSREWCMPAGQKILTDHGYINIENIKVGDNVLTDSGLYYPVTKIYNRKYAGPMVKLWIDNFKQPLMFTTNHQIKIIRDDKEAYIDSSRIREGDILKFPNHIQTDFSINDLDLAWLIGLIIGDGSISNSGLIEIIFNLEDKNIIEKAKNILQNITTSVVRISERDRQKRNILRLETTSKILATWLKSVIGGKSYNKCIPDLIVNSSQEIRIACLKGLWSADGSFKNGEDNGKRACYSTISKKLASQVSEILHSIGISCNIVKNKRTTNKSNGNIVPIYRINSYGKSFDKLYNIINGKENIKYNGYNYTVKKVEIDDDYNDSVYNCEVAEDHSYIVYPGFVVHNCCNFSAYKRICLDNKLPVNPIGDTKGFSEAAKGIDDLVSKYQNASVFFNTSIISPVPTALLEAMACGCPVVSTATCMIPEIIIDGYNGFISNDENYLKEKLIWCLANPKEAKELGKNARQTIVEMFSLEQNLSNWDKTFKDVYGTGYN